MSRFGHFRSGMLEDVAEPLGLAVYDGDRNQCDRLRIVQLPPSWKQRCQGIFADPALAELRLVDYVLACEWGVFGAPTELLLFHPAFSPVPFGRRAEYVDLQELIDRAKTGML